MLSDQQLLQYSRHLMLPEVDMAGQERWLASRVLVVGLGGLGSPVALYLATAGVGQLILVDDDQVEISNLQRQIIHTRDQLGKSKVASAAHQLALLSPETKVTTIEQRLTGLLLEDSVANVDLVVDCSDNFETRHALNRACFKLGVPLVSGAAIRFEGQVSVYNPKVMASPCYRCLFPEDARVEQNCSTSGVFAPLVGMVGAVQAAEALKVLAGLGQDLTGKLLMVDALTMEWRTLKLTANPKCPVCGDRDR